MKKIELNPESLQVQTFAVSAHGVRGVGTVRAHHQTRPIVQCYSQSTCVYPCTDDPVQCA